MSLKVTIIENGPAIISTDGAIEIESFCSPKNNNIMTKEGEYRTLAICRCGKSADGVWCDGSHKFKIIEENE